MIFLFPGVGTPLLLLRQRDLRHKTKRNRLNPSPSFIQRKGSKLKISLYKLFCNSIFSFSFANLEVALVALRADRDGTTASEETLILRHEQFLQLHSLRIGLPASSSSMICDIFTNRGEGFKLSNLTLGSLTVHLLYLKEDGVNPQERSS